MNNPLKYNDPDGEFIFTAFLGPVGAIIDAACWGAVIGGAGYTASVAFSDGGFSNWNSGNFWQSVGMGAISGAATAGIGSAFGAVGSNGLMGEVARAYTHGFANGMISEAFGGDFMSGFAAGGLSSIAGSSFMMYGGKFANSTLGAYSFSGLGGGIGSELSGGNFWQGAAIGVMNAGLNHIQSMVGEAGARYFANKKAAYDYMWDNSFSDGDPLREVSAWELENGDAIVLPYDKNGLHYSDNSALSVSKANSQGGRMVKFNGKAYAISTHVHTHPSIHSDGGIGLSGMSGDAAMYNFLKRPIHVLYNKSLYSATYSAKGRWYWKNLGSW